VSGDITGMISVYLQKLAKRCEDAELALAADIAAAKQITPMGVMPTRPILWDEQATYKSVAELAIKSAHEEIKKLDMQAANEFHNQVINGFDYNRLSLTSYAVEFLRFMARQHVDILEAYLREIVEGTPRIGTEPRHRVPFVVAEFAPVFTSMRLRDPTALLPLVAKINELTPGPPHDYPVSQICIRSMFWRIHTCPRLGELLDYIRALTQAYPILRHAAPPAPLPTTEGKHPSVKLEISALPSANLPADPARQGNVWCKECSQSLMAARGAAHLVSKKHADAVAMALCRTVSALQVK